MRASMIFVFAAAATFHPGAALAYIGPGLGVGAITAVFGVIAALVMAFIALLWYPVKRVFRKRKPTAEVQDPS